MKKQETRVSDYFKLNKTQVQLDFVDVALDRDILLFVDPYSFTLEEDPWFVECNNLLIDFFSKVLEAIRANRGDQASKLLGNLHEPSDTHLGFAATGNTGRGIGKSQSNNLLAALTKSRAAKTGSLNDLSDCEMLIPGISSDKVSDITTNVIRGQLLLYTEEQCRLHNIPVSKIAGGVYWDGEKGNWITRYANLPVANGERLLLVPKACVRFRPSITSKQFYNHYVLNFLQNEHLHANDGLVHTLKSGKRVVFKRELKIRYPEDKEFLFDFSQRHPEILKKYRDDAAKSSRPVRDEDLEFGRNETREIDCLKLAADLNKIPEGAADAAAYHSFMMGALQAIFFPSLRNPKKEAEINEGRKRIDISFYNGAKDGFFKELRDNYGVFCPLIFFECKNYHEDLKNPELDQMIGRFNDKRGKFGIITCRKVDDKPKLLMRCKDALRDGHGHILILDDGDVAELLKMRQVQKFKGINEFMNEKIRQLVM